MTTEKILIKFGKFVVGDDYKDGMGREYKITGLGQPFIKYIPDEDACCFGLVAGASFFDDLAVAL